LKDTRTDPLQSLKTEIATIAKSELGDWESDPLVGASLIDFKGEPNTRVTGDAIRNRLYTKIVNSGLVKPEDLLVKVTPIHINQVMINVSVKASPTTANGLQPGDNVTVSMVYDSSEHDIFFLVPNLKERAAR
jgi:hypothetical protein